MNVVRKITVRTQFDGMHAWPDAPTEVAFLRAPHRHVFSVEVIVPVDHADRSKEFFLVKSRLDDVVGRLGIDDEDVVRLKRLGSMSCEMICDVVYEYLRKDLGDEMVVKVCEDDQNCAVCEYAA